jgi:Gpi18-like mannosyltransferase
VHQKAKVLLKRLVGNEFLIALVVGIALISVCVFLGWENNKVIPVNPAPSAHYNLEPNNPLKFLSNWDGPNYLSIAKNGYTNKNEANFFPLYPLLIRAVHVIIPSLLDSGLIVAWCCLIGALYYYLKILKHFFKIKDNVEAIRGLLFLALFPTGVFLIATYTESLFAFLALGALYYALRNSYIKATIFTAFLTATHINGLLVVLLIGLIFIEKKLNPLKIIASMIVGCLGLVSYMIYQKVRFHSALEFLHAQKLHNWINLSGIHILGEIATLNGLFFVLVLCSAAYWWHRKKSFSIYSLSYSTIIFVGGRDFGGFGRYSLMAFPLELMLYDYLRNKKLGYPIVLTLSAILWCFVTIRYAGGYTGG